MNRPTTIALAVALALAGCSGGATMLDVPAQCTTDAECPTGKGCYLVSAANGYCSPLCDEDKTCPAKFKCPYTDLIVSDESPSCESIGQHNGRGVCDLYEGSYGPANCDLATIGSPTTTSTTSTGGSTVSTVTKINTATKTSTTTSTSCTLTKCSGSGFTYSCGSGSSSARTTYSYDGSGTRTGWSTTVSYSNGKSVSCQAYGTYGSSGSCSGSGGASCRW